MPESLPSPTMRGARSALIGSLLMYNVALGTEAHQDKITAMDPLADDRVAVQGIIENPDPYISDMRGYFELSYGGTHNDGIDDKAERLNTVILHDLFLEELDEVVGAPPDMELIDIRALEESKKAELFAKLQELALTHYDIELGFKQYSEVIYGPANSATGEYSVAEQANLEDMETRTIYYLASALSQIPKSYLTAIGLERITLYDLVPGRKGISAIGYPDGHGTINMDVDVRGDTLFHEVGHELNREIHGEWYAEDATFDALAKLELTGEGLHPLTSNILYKRVHYEELNATRDRLDAETESYEDRTSSEERVSCEVASRHPADAQNIRYIDTQPANNEEHKADLIMRILSGGLRDILDPCKPRLYALTSELLAQLHSIDPDATRWLIASSLPETREFQGWTGMAQPKPPIDFMRALRTPSQP